MVTREGCMSPLSTASWVDNQEVVALTASPAASIPSGTACSLPHSQHGQGKVYP